MIKQPGFNPYPHNLFSVKIFCHHPKDGTSKFYELFKDYIDKMPLLIQQIDLPQFDITNQAFHVHTQNGEYKSIGNNIVNAQGQLTMKMLDTENSIIAHFFYPWLNIIAYAGVYNIGGLYANICTGNDWPYPRIDIQIDYYLDKNVIEYVENRNDNYDIPSNFTYIFKGCFPYKVQSVNVRHTAPAQGEYIRGVTFQYNNAICIPNATLNNFYGTDIYTLDAYNTYKYKQQQKKQVQIIQPNKQIINYLNETNPAGTQITPESPELSQNNIHNIAAYKNTSLNNLSNENIDSQQPPPFG